MSEGSAELRSVRFKPEPGVAPGHIGGFPWRRGDFLEFLLAIPYLAFRFRTTREGATPLLALPSLAELNALLALGEVDEGMGGGCKWKPFEIDQSEYELLTEHLLTDPRFTFVLADGAHE